jgi:hypothetical protein
MVGGFYQGINFLVYWSAHFFSGKLFIQSIGSKLFIVRKSKHEHNEAKAKAHKRKRRQITPLKPYGEDITNQTELHII